MNLTVQKLANLKIENQKHKVEIHKVFSTLKKKKPKELDELAQALHLSVFEQIDCLSCANCCKSLGPRITDLDISRLSKQLRMKPSEFISQYLLIDEDQDYVFKSMPCPFLLSDNYCMVYENRPKACREYPHTDRKRFYQLLTITEKNLETCPAVMDISKAIVQHFS
jgi:Fe-S-cluster containining protein